MLKRLNIGSGQRKFTAPFVNVDVNPKWQPDVIADGASMPMFEDGSADLIVLHHVYEHFGLGEADSLVKECHRILAPEGSLLVFVPDMRELAKAWLKGDIDDYIYMVNVYGAYMDSDTDRHRWGNWAPSLKKSLFSAAPWRAIKPFDWRPITGSDLAKDWWVCAMECIK